jgi:hypothetical protein
VAWKGVRARLRRRRSAAIGVHPDLGTSNEASSAWKWWLALGILGMLVLYFALAGLNDLLLGLRINGSAAFGVSSLSAAPKQGALVLTAWHAASTASPERASALGIVTTYLALDLFFIVFYTLTFVLLFRHAKTEFKTLARDDRRVKLEALGLDDTQARRAQLRAKSYESLAKVGLTLAIILPVVDLIEDGLIAAVMVTQWNAPGPTGLFTWLRVATAAKSLLVALVVLFLLQILAALVAHARGTGAVDTGPRIDAGPAPDPAPSLA